MAGVLGDFYMSTEQVAQTEVLDDAKLEKELNILWMDRKGAEGLVAVSEQMITKEILGWPKSVMCVFWLRLMEKPK